MIYNPKYFKLEELLVTDTGLPNVPSWSVVNNLLTLTEQCLDPLRIAFKRPIHINSGFRTLDVNKSIGGAKNSDHLCNGTTSAADITTGSVEFNKLLFDYIIKSNIKYKQLIDEKNYTWIHISHDINNNKMQVLHI